MLYAKHIEKNSRGFNCAHRSKQFKKERNSLGWTSRVSAFVGRYVRRAGVDNPFQTSKAGAE
jgi:hypothetical protein